MASAPASGYDAWRDLQNRTARRVGALGALRGAAMALVLVGLWLVKRIVIPASAGSEWSWIGNSLLAITGAGIGALAGWWMAFPNPRRAAVLLERRVPSLNNLLVTAEELHGAPLDASANAGVRALVAQRANRAASAVDLSAAFALSSSWWTCGATMLVCLVLAFAGDGRLAAVTSPVRAMIASAARGAAITSVTVRITPPVYSRQVVVEQRDPARIDLLQGSTVQVTVQANADSLRVTTRDSVTTLVPSRDGLFTFEMIAAADGFVGLEPRIVRDSTGGDKRLLGLTVRADNAPRVRITAPATDLLVPNANRTLSVRVQADDDLAVGTLRVKYTKVSGSGERFSFSEGELSTAISRASRQLWTARAELALAPLLQEPGDLVVYRAVVTDSRPGSAPVESDALIVELAAPGGVAAMGFALDPDEDRYALSQQMVIQKTERLIAQRSALAPALLAEQAMQLASEQRRVRAEFVFMMGGEFAQQATSEDGMMELDETEEAESEADLAAGRMVNRGRTALLSSVRAMSRAAVALTTADLVPALAQERRALLQLQEAFARNRFLMRALSQREQIDLTRRLTGVREGIATQRLPMPEGESSDRQQALRALLADLADLVTTPAIRAIGSRETRSLVDIAARVLRLDPSSPVAQRVATQLTVAGQRGRTERNVFDNTQRALLDSAATGLTAMLRVEARPSAPSARSLDARRLQSALDEALTGVRRATLSRPGTP